MKGNDVFCCPCLRLTDGILRCAKVAILCGFRVEFGDCVLTDTEAHTLRPKANWLLAVTLAVRARLTGKLFLFVARLAGAGAGLLVQVLLAHALSPAQLGLFYTATSAAVVASLVASSGYDGIAARFVLRYKGHQRPLLYGSFLRQAWREASLAALVLGSLPLALGLLWPSFEHDTRIALALSALSIPALMSLRIIGGFAGAERRFSLALLPEILLRPILFLAIVGALVSIGFDMNSSDAVLLFAVLAYIAAVIQYSPLAKVLPRKQVEVPARLSRYWRRQAWPMTIVMLFTALFADLAVVVQSPLLDPVELAQFGVCIKIAMLVGFVVQVSHSLVLPDLADAYAQRKVDQVREVLLKAAPFPVLVCISALLGTWFFGDRLLSMFGEEFRPAHGPLLCLVGCQLFRAVAGPGPSLLMLEGAQKMNFWTCVCSCVTLALASAVLSPFHGLWGAVTATSIAYSFWIVVSAYCLHKMAAPRADLLGLFQLRQKSALSQKHQ